MDGATESVTSSGAAWGRSLTLEGLLVADTYRVSARLGGGGMGEVYQAEHLRLGNPVAIKFLRAGAEADARSTGRFHHEARRAAAIRSEHVVRVFDYGRLADGTPYLVMERLFGEDLRGLLAREGPLPIRRAVQLVLGACRGLAVVHAAGLVHRDLKPANLFVEQAPDGTELCKVLDFGVAKALESDTTRPGSLVGTVRYMAPEQLENAASTTLTADIYALGAILYECVTGVPAHQGATLEETMFNIVHRGVPRPSVRRPVPEPLELAMMRALAREPARRFPSMDDFARALAPFGPVLRPLAAQARADDPTLDEARKPRARRASTRTLLIAAASAVAGALGGWVLRGEPPEHAEAGGALAVLGPAKATTLPILQPAVATRPFAAEPIATAMPSVAPPPLPLPPAPARAVARVTKRPLPKSAANADGAPPPPPSSRPPVAGRFDPKDPYE